MSSYFQDPEQYSSESLRHISWIFLTSVLYHLIYKIYQMGELVYLTTPSTLVIGHSSINRNNLPNKPQKHLHLTQQVTLRCVLKDLNLMKTSLYM